MGLDTSHDCWHGAYSAFHRWRTKIAEVAGIPFPLMEGIFGYGGITDADVEAVFSLWTHSGMKLDWLHKLASAARDCGRNLPIPWTAFANDPLTVLLHHSDCDGEIPAKACGPLAARLQALLPLLPDGEGGGHIGNWREKTQTFIDGLRAAEAAGEAVEFH